jgi:hypothetical protein
MSDTNNKWSHSREGDTPQEDTKGPTGSHHMSDPQLGTSSDEFVQAQPNRNQDLQNDLENDYPDSNRNNQQMWGNRDASDDNPIMGTENTFDSFNDTDPNRYNNNAGLGTAGSGGEHEGNYSNETKEVRDDELDNENDNTDNNKTPKHPEF